MNYDVMGEWREEGKRKGNNSAFGCERVGKERRDLSVPLSLSYSLASSYSLSLSLSTTLLPLSFLRIHIL